MTAAGKENTTKENQDLSSIKMLPRFIYNRMYNRGVCLTVTKCFENFTSSIDRL